MQQVTSWFYNWMVYIMLITNYNMFGQKYLFIYYSASSKWSALREGLQSNEN